MKGVTKPSRLLLLAASATGGYAAWRVGNSPLPQEDPGCMSHVPSTIETFQTEDGVALKLKRYPSPGAQPVLFAHGFSSNGLEFDLPHRRHNLALYLAERGYDVWISSFRGCGYGPYKCRARDWNHSMDELAGLDAPALVNGVTLSTGRRPVWIGHSMGGIVLYMYLLGATADKAGGRFRAAVDPGLIEERNRSILGAVTIGSPPSLNHGGGSWVAALLGLPLAQPNTRLLMRYVDFMARRSPRVALSGMRDFVTRFPRLGRTMAARGPVASALYNPQNVDPDVGYSLLKWASDNVTARMTNQILALALDPHLRDCRQEFDYTANMHRVTAPIFFLTGSEDFAGEENVRADGYERVSSPVKEFRSLPGYGHTDLVMGKRVYEDVYPLILSWIERLIELRREMVKAASRSAAYE